MRAGRSPCVKSSSCPGFRMNNGGMNRRADRPRSMRGRQALGVDLTLILVSATAAAAVIGIPVLFLVPSVRAIALIASGVYHHIGPVAGRRELLRLAVSYFA